MASESRHWLGAALTQLRWLAPVIGSVALFVHFYRVGHVPSLSLTDMGTLIGAILLFTLYALVFALVIIAGTKKGSG